MKRILAGLALLALTACSKKSAPTTAVVDSGPDNAMTRYAENLVDDQRRAQLMVERANRAIAKEENVMKDAGMQQQNPQNQ